MSPDLRRDLGAENLLDRVSDHLLPRLAVEAQGRRIDLLVPELAVAFLDQYGVAFGGVLEKRLNQRLGRSQLSGSLLDPRFQDLVDLRQLLLGFLRSRDVMGDADEAEMFSVRAPTGLRFRT